jgi:hypothetical protein
MCQKGLAHHGKFNEMDTAMLDVRFEYFHFKVEVPSPDYNLQKLRCGACFSRLIMGPVE